MTPFNVGSKTGTNFFQGCNLMQGFCKRPGFCSCNDGWSGPTCEDCARNPNCVNGYCTKVPTYDIFD